MTRKRVAKDSPLMRGQSSVPGSAKTADDLPGAHDAAPSVPTWALDLKVAAIDPNPHQPRELFGGEEDDAMIESVRQLGVLQPIWVRRHPDREGRWQLIAGERRLNAAKAVGIDVIPAREFAATDEQMAEWALVENDQRRNLTLWEHAKATLRVRDLLMRMGRKHSQEAVAEALGVSKGTVNTRLSIADQITERVLESAGYVDLPADQALEGRRSIYDVPQNALKSLAKIKDEDRRIEKLKEHLFPKRGGPRQKQAFTVRKDAEGQLRTLTVGKAISALTQEEAVSLYRQTADFMAALHDRVARVQGGRSVIQYFVAEEAVLAFLPTSPVAMAPEEIRRADERLTRLVELYRRWVESGIYETEAAIRAEHSSRLTV